MVHTEPDRLKTGLEPATPGQPQGSITAPLPPSPGRAQPAPLGQATALNLFFPGLGLFLLGWRWVGALFALAFLGCFAAMIGLFLTAYSQYIQITLSNDLLQGNRIEQMENLFHSSWLIGLLLAALFIYITSALLTPAAKRQSRPQR